MGLLAKLAMCMLAALLACGLAAVPAAASPGAKTCESLTDFDQAAWPFTRISFSGDWRAEHYTEAHGGQIYTSSGNGAGGANDRASVSVGFYGSEVKLVAARYWQCGWCAVYLDGRFRGMYNLSSNTPQFGYVVFQASRLRRCSHEIRVVNLGIPGSCDPAAWEYDLHFVNVDYLAVR